MRKLRELLPCVLFIVLATQGARADWPTSDEGPFLHYGLLHLRGDVDRRQVWNSKLPVTALHAVPVLAMEKLSARQPAFTQVDARMAMAPWVLPYGRAVSILLGAILVWVVGRGAASLAGPRAGEAAALFAALEPNLLAHGHLVTADGGATLATLLLALATVRFTKTRAPRDAALLGGALGLALLCKFMLVVWAPLALLAVLLARSFTWKGAGVALLCTVLVLDLGFFLRGIPGRLPEHPKSHKVSLLKTAIDGMPLPVPTSYLEGFDWTAGDEERGNGFGNLYLLGETQTDRRGWWFYYAVAFGLKTPLALLVLAVLGAFGNRGRDFWTLRVFGIGWFLFLSLSNHAQIGIRHALPIVPLLAIEAGAAYSRLERSRPWIARALVVWFAASVVSFGADYIPYTNELIRDRKLAYRVFADSNLDWGQAELEADQFRKSHPDVVWQPPKPVKALVLINVNALVGVTEPPEKFAWLRAFTPVAHVRHAFLVFDTR